jgi:hypothetical protein
VCLSTVMSFANNPEDEEKVKALDRSLQDGKEPDTEDNTPNGHSNHEASRAVSIRSDMTAEMERNPEDEARDLEELQVVPSGPVYSAFSKNQKRYIILVVTLAAFISPTSANIYFPALNPLAAELAVSNTLINLTLTSYMIFQGLSPTIFGDLSDMAGRRPAYILAFIIYLGANVGLALQDSYVALLLLRCLQSTGSSGAIALGYGVVADVSSSAERGSYMGIVGMGIMMAQRLALSLGVFFVYF